MTSALNQAGISCHRNLILDMDLTSKAVTITQDNAGDTRATLELCKRWAG